jgi:hypothetical protein
MTLELSLTAEPLPAGEARALAFHAKNASSGHVLLESVTVAPGSALFAAGPSFSWKRSADGAILYDAARDVYVHATHVPGLAAVPLHVGVLPPGARAETLLPVRLGASARVALRVAFRTVASLEGRVYSSPRGLAGEKVVFSPGFAPGPAIVRDGDLPRREAVLEADLRVEGELPAGAFARSRALGWLERGAPREGIVVDGHEVAPEVADLMDLVWPGDPFVVLFRGERGEAVRRALAVELNPARQGLVDYEKGRALVAATARHGARLRVGLPWEGFVVE